MHGRLTLAGCMDSQCYIVLRRYSEQVIWDLKYRHEKESCCVPLWASALVPCPSRDGVGSMVATVPATLCS